MKYETYLKQRAKVEPWDLEEFDRMYENSKRAYDGQVHTSSGARGSFVVEGVTMRDLVDCLVLAYFQSSGLPKEEWPDDVYELKLETMDPIAISQNMMCNVEKMMGTYPNVPPLKKVDE